MLDQTAHNILILNFHNARAYVQRLCSSEKKREKEFESGPIKNPHLAGARVLGMAPLHPSEAACT